MNPINNLDLDRTPGPPWDGWPAMPGENACPDCGRPRLQMTILLGGAPTPKSVCPRCHPDALRAYERMSEEREEEFTAADVPVRLPGLSPRLWRLIAAALVLACGLLVGAWLWCAVRGFEP